MMAIIGFILLVAVIVAVKVADEKIRKHHWAKVAVNVSFIAGVIFIIAGIVQLFMWNPLPH